MCTCRLSLKSDGVDKGYMLEESFGMLEKHRKAAVVVALVVALVVASVLATISH